MSFSKILLLVFPDQNAWSGNFFHCNVKTTWWSLWIARRECAICQNIKDCIIRCVSEGKPHEPPHLHHYNKIMGESIIRLWVKSNKSLNNDVNSSVASIHFWRTYYFQPNWNLVVSSKEKRLFIFQLRGQQKPLISAGSRG